MTIKNGSWFLEFVSLEPSYANFHITKDSDTQLVILPLFNGHQAHGPAPTRGNKKYL